MEQIPSAERAQDWSKQELYPEATNHGVRFLLTRPIFSPTLAAALAVAIESAKAPLQAKLLLLAIGAEFIMESSTRTQLFPQRRAGTKPSRANHGKFCSWALRNLNGSQRS